ncbi:hypothetical protein DL89DRAFT_296679 [Linderina pennispora]|uniref:Uncharacterized protein n=1 Tax=Linderina pennispora TaxID=61395 RepID=A0A1Y1VUS8_9FUNG|nr:uncharacterized protein DL89DRAFT_296679 [Linderina pennispora]ORX65039.1 hypothetical protein DL89DRAFT_296679 [Linderina pennispora]
MSIPTCGGKKRLRNQHMSVFAGGPKYDSDKRDSSTVGRMGGMAPFHCGQRHERRPGGQHASLYMQSLTSMQMNRNSDLFSSIGSMHTGATSDAFFTPDSSMAQINIMDGPSIARILSNTSQYSTLSSDEVFEPAASHLDLPESGSHDIIHGEIVTTSLRRADLTKGRCHDVSAIDVSGTLAPQRLASQSGQSGI